jgi:hypothetical protein
MRQGAAGIDPVQLSHHRHASTDSAIARANAARARAAISAGTATSVAVGKDKHVALPGPGFGSAPPGRLAHWERACLLCFPDDATHQTPRDKSSEPAVCVRAPIEMAPTPVRAMARDTALTRAARTRCRDL